jgi:hypothetical protein
VGRALPPLEQHDSDIAATTNRETTMINGSGTSNWSASGEVSAT